MGLNLQVRYASKANDQNGRHRGSLTRINFVMRYDSQRIYLMDFDRQSTEIFDGQSFRFSDKEILLDVDSPGKSAGEILRIIRHFMPFPKEMHFID